MRLLTSTLILLLSISLQWNFAQTEQLNISLIDSLDYEPTLNDIWGYAAPDDREYALVGMTSGVSIVEVTPPIAEDGLEELYFIPGDTSTWRDIKTLGNYAYITNEKGGGLQIVDLEGLPDTSQITIRNWTGGPWADSTLVYTQAHNIFIDQRGIGYIVGADFSKGGVIMIDLIADPINPPIIGVYDDFYVHDVYVRDNIMWTAEIYAGEFAVVDVTDKKNPVTLARHSTPSNFTHNTWLSDDGNTLYTTDERGNAFVGAYDVSDLSDIRELDRYQTAQSLNQGVIPHNTFVYGEYLVTSYYTDGVTIVDAHNPENLIEVGYYDTSESEGSGFRGCWGVYPYLPSGMILASDRQNGLFVLQPEYLKACYLRGQVTDAITDEPLTDVTLTISEQEAATTHTDFNGEYETGLGASGLYEVTLIKYGYPITTITEVGLVNGETTELNVELEPIEGFQLNIQAIDADTEQPIPNVQFRVSHSLKEFLLESDASGKALLDLIYTENYEILAGKWGYQTAAIQDIFLDSNTGSITIPLQKGYYDDFTFAFDWTIKSNASAGVWERVQPVGTLYTGQFISPQQDVSTDLGDRCYITGNSTSLSENVNDGFTTLQSPIFDATIFDNPHLQYNRWYFLQNSNFFPSDDTLYIRLSNGMDTVILETLWNNDVRESKWSAESFLIRELIEPTEEMQLFFEVQDAGAGHLVEAAFDFFRLEEGPDIPQPTLAATVVQGCTPLVVTFQNTTEGNVESLQWKFEGGDVFITNNPTPTVTYDTPGTYDVTLRVTTDGGTEERVFSNYITVLEGTTPDLELTSSSEIACQGSTITLTASSNENVTYTWTDAATGAAANSSVELEINESGTYGVVILDDEGCTAFQQLDIEVPMPTVEVNFPSDPICSGTLINLAIINPREDYTYYWEGNEINTTEGVSVLATTSIDAPTYEVRAVEANGCEVIEIIELDIIESKAAFTTQISEICAGEHITFFDLSENALSYAWIFENKDTGNTLTSDDSNPTITFNEAGTYTVTQNIDGCNIDAITKENILTVHTLPEVSIATVEFYCLQSGIELTATVTNPETTTFEWTGDNLLSSNEQTVTAMPDAIGTYEYSVIVTDEMGCSNQAIGSAEVVICDSIEEWTQQYFLQIFPNPTNHQLNVSMNLPNESNLHLQLVNVLGQSVQTATHTDVFGAFQQSLNVSSLSSGLYYLVIEVNGEQATQKVIVE